VSGKAEEAAARLLRARRRAERLDALPRELAPRTPAEAYAVQDRVTRALGRIAGWKVGAESPSAEPACAPLVADLVVASPAQFAAARFPLRGIEGELAFRFARPLPARAAAYGEDEVWAAAGTLHAPIELVDSRFADFRAQEKLVLLADNQSNGAFCYGPALAEWRALDFLQQEARLFIDGKEVARAVGGNAAGHPRRLLAWLANHCARRGCGIAAGDIVTTGSHTGLVFLAAGANATVHFPGIGEASLTLSV
jgi:2-keto-4-pentenoate hydratase